MKKVLIIIENINNDESEKEKLVKDLAKQVVGVFEVSVMAKNIVLNEVGEWLRMKGASLYNTEAFITMPKEYDIVVMMDEWAEATAGMIQSQKKIRFAHGISLFENMQVEESREEVSEESSEDDYKHVKKPAKKKIADIVIPHHDRHDRLKDCLDNLDNSEFYIHIESGGTFAENCNRGAEKAKTDTIIFLNDDTIPNSENLKEVAQMKSDIVGVAQEIPGVEGILYGINFDITEAGELKGGYAKEIDDALIPCGVCFAVKKKAWKKLKGLDERFRNGGEDSDFGIRALKEGLSIEFYPKPIYHHHSQSEGRLAYSKENQVLLNKLWNNKNTREMIFGKKKILVATNHLDRLGGSETYTYALVKELERLGHKVEVFTFTKDEAGIQKELKDYIVEQPKEKYDIIFINHNTCLQALGEVKGFKIFTSHGVFPKIEQPMEGADKYVAISEEVSKHLKDLGFENTVILNGIDCDRFKPKKKIRKTQKSVLSLCHGEEANENIKKACKELKLDFKHLPKDTFKVENEINKADIVFSLGRGAYEAMACGRDVIVYDSRPYVGHSLADGRMTRTTIKEMLKNNCSGRRYEKDWKLKDVKAEIKKYNQEAGKDNRAFAVMNLNIKKQVKKYLELYEI